MAYNEALTNRIRESVLELMKPTDKIEEKRMFNGVAFMVNDKMCVTAGDERIMCRIDPAIYEEALKKDGCTPMIMKGRLYKGYVNVSTDGITHKADLDYWVKLALDFNEKAKASPRKKKSHQ